MKTLIFVLMMFASSLTFAADMTKGPGHTTDHIFTEIWCVDGYRILYAENTENGTFQFFQIHQNANIAVKGIQCNGKEARIVE